MDKKPKSSGKSKKDEEVKELKKARKAPTKKTKTAATLKAKKPKMEESTNQVKKTEKVETQIKETAPKTEKPKTKSQPKVSLEEINIIQKNIVLFVISGLAIVSILLGFFIWNFFVPEDYRLATTLEKAKKGRLFVRADELKADDNHDVAVIEPCDMAIRYDKRFQPTFNITTENQFGVYQQAINEIFGEEMITVYDFQLADNQNQSGTLIACLESNKKDNLTAENVEKVIQALDKQNEGQEGIEKVEQNVENIPLFNQVTRNLIGKDLFRSIKYTNTGQVSQDGQQQPETVSYNTFIGVDNKLIFVAQQNSRSAEIVAQINSLNPSKPTFDTKTKTDKFLEGKNRVDEEIKNQAKKLNLSRRDELKYELKLSGYDPINFISKKNYAPQTFNNFAFLVDRGYYNDTIIHRMVKQENFNILQGGDKESRNGTGGRSAYYINDEYQRQVRDELWKEEPKYNQGEDGKVTIENEPKLRTEELYKDFNGENGSLTYKKGTIAMAKTSDPNSASSQFFLILTDTILPAQYTSFGIIDEEDMGILDKILEQASPKGADSNSTPNQDESESIKPDPEIKVEYIKII